ncbi:hypothetical protein PInf_025299 [Phytophthora infestans]|nr:hypothetical protein PInf_025299 [Phytophthora infestans]
MTQKPYETTERRKQREREAQEATEREKARKKDDVGGRALIDMMDGTLEVRKDPLAAQELVKEAWMLTIPPEEMTAEQKKLVAQFEAAQAKFEEEKEKYRKSLDLELRKTRGEVIDLCRAFDEKLRALRDRYMATHRAVLAQELYELRLGEELMAREQLEIETERLEDDAREMQDIEARAQAESDRFAAQLEACREEQRPALQETLLKLGNYRSQFPQLVPVPFALVVDEVEISQDILAAVAAHKASEAASRNGAIFDHRPVRCKALLRAEHARNEQTEGV